MFIDNKLSPKAAAEPIPFKRGPIHPGASSCPAAKVLAWEHAIKLCVRYSFILFASTERGVPEEWAWWCCWPCSGYCSLSHTEGNTELVSIQCHPPTHTTHCPPLASAGSHLSLASSQWTSWHSRDKLMGKHLRLVPAFWISRTPFASLCQFAQMVYRQRGLFWLLYQSGTSVTPSP